MRRLILRSFQSPGDVVMLTAAVRDLHAACPGQFVTDVRTSADALWLHNPASYQAVVDHFRDKIHFVQCGEAGHWHQPLQGVTNLLGRTSLREFVRLIYDAEGVVCPVTGCLAGACTVAVVGGAILGGLTGGWFWVVAGAGVLLCLAVASDLCVRCADEDPPVWCYQWSGEAFE